jgi:2,3-bisphosphoglycerate-dependent phosphoglycerate mutase
MNIYIIRHATTGLLEQGQKPKDTLSSEGRLQAHKLTEYFTPDIHIKTLISSPFTRALQTAEVLHEHFKLPINTDDRLREISLWLSPYDMHNDSSGEYQVGLEMLSEARKKVKDLFYELHNSHKSYENAVLVCHGNIIRAIMCYALKMSLESVVRLKIDNASVTLIQHVADTDGVFFHQLWEFNNTHHLKD